MTEVEVREREGERPRRADTMPLALTAEKGVAPGEHTDSSRGTKQRNRFSREVPEGTQPRQPVDVRSSSLQKHKIIHARCLKPPNLWKVVTAGAENKYRL